MLKKYFKLRKLLNRADRKKYMRYFLQNPQVDTSRLEQGFTAHELIRLQHYTDNEIKLIGKSRLYYAETKTMFTKEHFWNLKSYDSLGLAKIIVSAELGLKKVSTNIGKGRVQIYVNILNKL